MTSFPLAIRNILRELEVHGAAHDAREPEHSRKLLNLEPETAQVVSILARSLGAQRALEVGTSNGYSTIWLAASIGPSGGHVISVDRSAEKHRMARENLLRAGVLDYVDLRCGDATDVVSSLPGPFDLVLFDADRKSAAEQLRLLLPKLAPKALILADNVLSHPSEIADYLAALDALPHLQHVVVPIGKGLSVALYQAVCASFDS